MSDRQDYEDWADDQDKRVFISQRHIVAQFSQQYRFPLTSLKTINAALEQAQQFSVMLLCEERANWYGLPIKFLYLAIQENQLLDCHSSLFYNEAESIYQGHHIELIEKICGISLLQDRTLSLESSDGRSTINIQKTESTFSIAIVESHSTTKTTRTASVVLSRYQDILVFTMPAPLNWLGMESWERRIPNRIALRNHTLAESDIKQIELFLSRSM